MSETLESIITQMLNEPLRDGMTPTRQLFQQLAEEDRQRKSDDDAGTCEDGDM